MTTVPLPLLVFTDLDGTLLDHDSYSAAPAMQALAAIRRVGGGVVLASSKTAAEIAPLRAALGLSDWPAIVENGAGVLPACADSVDGDDYRDIRSRLDSLPEDLRKAFSGFGDWSDAQVADATGLPLEQATLARRRQFSEPGLCRGDPAIEPRLRTALAALGLSARQGGRFLTVSFGSTKADRMTEIRANLNPRLTVALGDAPNDVEMIEAADIGVIVANPHGSALPRLSGEHTGRVRRTDAPGPVGWNRAMLDILDEYNLTERRAGHG